MKRWIFWGMAALATACAPDKEEATTCPKVIQGKEAPESSLDFHIRDAWREGNLLKVRISHGGGCDAGHRFDLYETGSLTACAEPRNALFVFTTKDPCKRLDESVVCFDLSPMLAAASGCQDQLRINGFDKPISLVR